jgi:hypothetical protein
MIVRRSKICALRWTLVWGVLFAVLMFVSIRMSAGWLIYTLDDPYIYLAVAENILRGGYGVNAQEFSSPSSSILYPLLLTLTVALGLGTAGPLLINALATGLSVWLLVEFFWRHAVGASDRRTVFAHMVCPLLILAINAFSLPLTGMEHSLHVLAVIITMRGLVAMAESGRVSVSLLVAIICMPFIRFEGIALSGAAILAMAAIGQWRAAGLSSAAIFAGFGAWAVLMQRLGLPFLPSSVLSKSAVAASAQGGASVGIVAAMRHNIGDSLNNRFGIIFTLAICALVATAQDREGRWRSIVSTDRLLAGVMVLALGAHLVAGRYGWFNRYEVYAVAIMVVGGVYLLRPVFLRLSDKGYVAARIGLLAALASFVEPYAWAVWQTPRASRNIYEQQYQMHRFATEFFPRRVAVNDLGWVSYDNDAFVLDLWGLGSETVRKLRAAGQINADVIMDLINKADVDFAMIYESWFEGAIPDSWCLMAILKGEAVTASSGEVLFYATRASAVANMRDALDRFAPTLPARVTLKRVSSACP